MAGDGVGRGFGLNMFENPLVTSEGASLGESTHAVFVETNIRLLSRVGADVVLQVALPEELHVAAVEVADVLPRTRVDEHMPFEVGTHDE